MTAREDLQTWPLTRILTELLAFRSTFEEIRERGQENFNKKATYTYASNIWIRFQWRPGEVGQIYRVAENAQFDMLRNLGESFSKQAGESAIAMQVSLT